MERVGREKEPNKRTGSTRRELLRVLNKGSYPEEEKNDLHEEKKNPQEENTNPQEQKANR